MITEEDFLVEDEHCYGRPLGEWDRDETRADRTRCPACEIHKRPRKQTFCEECWQKMETRHRSLQVLKAAWGADLE